MPVSGVILAGGISQRLGTNKALVKIGGKPLIQRVTDSLAPLCAEFLLVVASPRQATLPLPPSTRVVTDRYPGCGSLGGIFSGLAAAAWPWSLVVACDMPFLNHDLLRYLVEVSPGFDAVVPSLAGRPEPLHALYSKACLGVMEAMLRKGELKIAPAFDGLRMRYVADEEIDRFDPVHLSFFNINTSADLQQARQLVRRGLARCAPGKRPSSASPQRWQVAEAS